MGNDLTSPPVQEETMPASNVNHDESTREVPNSSDTAKSSIVGVDPDRDSSQDLDRQIHMLIGCSEEKRIALEDLPDLYQQKYSNEFPHGKLGQAELSGVLEGHSLVTILELPCGTKYCVRRDDTGMFEEETRVQLVLTDQTEVVTRSQSIAESSDRDAPMLEATPTKHPEMTSVSSSSPTSTPEALSNMAEHVQELILDLISKSSESKVMLAKLQTDYFSAYNATIPFKAHGHKQLKPFLETLPKLSVRGSLGSCHVVATEVPSDISHPVPKAEEPDVCSESQDDISQQSGSTRSHDVLPLKKTGSTYKRQPEIGTTDGKKAPKLVIEEAAANISSKLHGRLLALLAEHPDGVTTSQVIKQVKGLVHYMRACANEAGLDFMSPFAFLTHCEGVQCKQVAGSKRFFLSDATHSYEATTDAAGSLDNKMDTTAAMDLAKLLETTYRNRPWPNSKKQLKKFITSSIDPLSSPAIALWLKRGLEEGLSRSKQNKEIIKRAMYQLKRLGCISGTDKSLVWDLKRVHEIAEMDNATAPSEITPRAKERDFRTALPAVGDAAVPLQSQLKERRSDFNGCVPVKVVDTVEVLQSVVMEFPINPLANPNQREDHIVAIDCEGVPESLFLIQIGTCNVTYVFDCVKLSGRVVCEALRPLLTCSHVTKLFHDIHKDSVALALVGGVFPLSHTLDTQLAMEAATGNLQIGFDQMLRQLGQERHPLKHDLKNKMDHGRIFAQRPLPPDVLEYAALDASLLLKAKEKLLEVLGSNRAPIQRASDRRAKMALASGGARQICFDVANSYAISSLELLQELRPRDILEPVSLEVSNDTGILLEMLPDDFCEDLQDQTQQLSDIILDKGREPFAWINGKRVHLGGENRTVSDQDIDEIVKHVGGFGGDNRAGLERKLHRISALRNRQQDIIGLTLRVGRHVSGNATMISDLMFVDCYQSILFLGEPGSGKTTVVRDVTKQLAERFNVCVVDTSNEIAGDGDIPHPCIGYARRMMVPCLDKQSSVMIECVQNHTPEVMVIDEIGRPTEVEAARTCKQRGVRLIASAHGDLRKLIKKPQTAWTYWRRGNSNSW